MSNFQVSVICCVCLLICAGCENTGGKRAVSGSVTLQGQPLDKATISFSKLPEVQRAEGTALIKTGKYSLPANQGLLPGTYLVRISALEEFNITPEEYAAGKTAPPPKERVPAKYNTASEQQVEVKDSGPNQFDFNID